MATVDAILSESLLEFGTSELIVSNIIKVLVEGGMDKDEADNIVIDRVYNKIPKRMASYSKTCG